ncbi:GTPase Era [Thiomicrospira microaerophila]|uniref:GTPase Era n=1 Tax=Thiomicrospira microaerophila TaxID=406020 RepID=UPI00200EF15E|nr:GTPase Era [Thiomicrospira microaerophila]UQB43218.1 GTPase Era [Thiomicrospira microaerophila]
MKPIEIDLEQPGLVEESTDFKAGFAAVIGRPNVGKSTLMNELLGQKLSITSHKPQTTRHRIHGIYTAQDHQIVYVDTPGMHLGGQKSINRYMNRAAKSAFAGVDVILFVIEAGRWSKEDQSVANQLKDADAPVVLIVNKVDKFKQKTDLLPFLQSLSGKVEFSTLIPVSAHKKSGLELIQKEILAVLPNQAPIFPEDYITDRSTKFLIAEIVREKLMRSLGDEVPYGATVEIEQFEQDPETGRWEINALILVEREGQKRIVIGDKGEKIKQMGIDARKDMIALLENRVHLELWVKVKENWSDDERALASLGYTESHN